MTDPAAAADDRVDAARSQIAAYERELESVNDLLDSHRTRLEILEPLAAHLDEELWRAREAEAVMSAALDAERARVGFRAMERIARGAARSGITFALGRAVARMIAGRGDA